MEGLGSRQSKRRTGAAAGIIVASLVSAAVFASSPVYAQEQRISLADLAKLVRLAVDSVVILCQNSALFK